MNGRHVLCIWHELSRRKAAPTLELLLLLGSNRRSAEPCRALSYL